MKIDPIMETYIDETVERSVNTAVSVQMKQFRKEINEFHREALRHMSALREGFRDDLKVVLDAVNSKPSREEVRIMIRDEIEPYVKQHSLMLIEIRSLREDVNSHDKRIIKLERKAT